MGALTTPEGKKTHTHTHKSQHTFSFTMPCMSLCVARAVCRDHESEYLPGRSLFTQGILETCKGQNCTR